MDNSSRMPNHPIQVDKEPRHARPRAGGGGGLRQRVIDAAIEEFYESGFSGATMRRVVKRAGAQMSSVYYHFDGKQQLLFEIMAATVNESTEFLQRALDAVPGSADSGARLTAALEALISWHTVRQREAFIADAELNRLDPEFRRQIVDLRDRQELMIRTIIEDGVSRGELRTYDPALVTRLLVSACTGVAGWYRPDGKHTAEQIASILSNTVLIGIAAPEHRPVS